MRIKRSTAEQQTIEHTVASLGALADAGHSLVEIRTVMEWLGVEWREEVPREAQLPPGVDPVTGCKPVTAPQQ